MQFVREHGSVRQLAGFPDELKKIFVTAHDIDSCWHVQIQSALQKYTDLGISKTINLPNQSLPGDIAETFLLAYQLGCKGITCYRDGCKEVQFLAIEPTQPAQAESCPNCP
jgi:ribonucleoside-diphosphate reductase alpha chain